MAFQTLFGASETEAYEVTPKNGVVVRKMPIGPTEATTTAKVRRGQDYFRQAVLNNFEGRCGVTGLAVSELLIASHILPWGKYEEQRLDVRNGLCLSRLHDAAFDRGLITFDAHLKMRTSTRLKNELPHRAVVENFAAYEGAELILSKEAVVPDEGFLDVHRREVFRN